MWWGGGERIEKKWELSHLVGWARLPGNWYMLEQRQMPAEMIKNALFDGVSMLFVLCICYGGAQKVKLHRSSQQSICVKTAEKNLFIMSLSGGTPYGSEISIGWPYRATTCLFYSIFFLLAGNREKQMLCSLPLPSFWFTSKIRENKSRILLCCSDNGRYKGLSGFTEWMIDSAKTPLSKKW